MAELSFQLRESGPEAVAVALSGRLDAAADTALLDAQTLARARSPKVLVVDLGAVESIDGAGLALLVRLWAWASREGQEVRCVGLGERCRTVIRELGLADALPAYRSEAAALAGDASEGPGAEPCGDPCPAQEWAGALGRAHLPGSHALNVDGRRVCGPLQGFGQLWHKVYRARLSGAAQSPEDVAALLKSSLGELWPEGNRLHLPPGGVVPGAVGAIDVRMPGGVPLATGVRVVHCGARSFTFATLAGHLQAGWITFGALEEDGCTVAQVQSLGRTGDPLYEIGFRLFGHAEQERFWSATLEALGRRLGVPVRVQSSKTRLDADVNWKAASNVWLNAAARTGLAAGGALLRKAFSRGRRGA